MNGTPEDSKRSALTRFIEHRRIDCLLLGLLAGSMLYLYMWGTGSYSLWDPWEPKYAQAMREMAERGDYLTPYLDDKVRWTKPILYYWAMAAPILIGGNNEFTVRFPSVIAAVLGVLALYFFLLKLHNRRTAFMGACILGTLPQYFYLARQAMPDMLLTLFLGTAMGFFALAQFGNEQRKRYLGLSYGSAALAFLTKGPVACVIALVAVILFGFANLGFRRRLSLRTALSEFRVGLKSYHVGMGIVIFLAIAGPWYTYMLMKHGYIFIDAFFRGENIHRFVEPVRGHDGIVTYYIQTIFHGMYPWSSLLPAGILFLFHGPKNDGDISKRWYYVSWFLSIFLVFTLAGTKQQHYLLPITPVTAILVALVWNSYFQAETPFWIPLVFLLSIAFTLLPIRDFFLDSNRYIFDNFTDKRAIDTAAIAPLLTSVFTGWSIAMVAAVFFRRSRFVAALAILVAYANGIYFLHYAIPEHTRHRTVKHYVETYRADRESDFPLVFYGKVRPSLNYYGGKAIYVHYPRGRERKLARDVKNRKNIYIIAEHRYKRRLLRILDRSSPADWRMISGETSRYDLLTNRDRFPSDSMAQ